MFVQKSSENTAKDDGAKYDSAKYNDRSLSTLIRVSVFPRLLFFRFSQLQLAGFAAGNSRSAASNLCRQTAGNCFCPNQPQLSTGQSLPK